MLKVLSLLKFSHTMGNGLKITFNYKSIHPSHYFQLYFPWSWQRQVIKCSPNEVLELLKANAKARRDL